MKTKTNEVLEENQHLRTKCLVYTRVMGYHRPVESLILVKKGSINNEVISKNVSVKQTHLQYYSIYAFGLS